MRILIAGFVFQVTISVAFIWTNQLDSRPTTDTEHAQDAAGPTTLPTAFDRPQSIPDILLQDPQYQQAGLIEQDPLRRAYTTNPTSALVNIYCTVSTERSTRTTTGSGFFINPHGVILTNAHVAQTLLLQELDGYGSTQCVARSGDPAVEQYEIELLYIPPSWILENAAAMVEERPVGTGERDYALVYVSDTLQREPLPAFFPTLAYDTSLFTKRMLGDTVIAAGYPAVHDTTPSDLNALRPQQASTTITNLYTFGSNYADVFSLAGSAVGAYGSSGGPVLNESGLVIGLITTRGDDTVDGSGSLRAITLSYIDRTITQETGFSLSDSTQGQLSFRSQTFKDTLVPFLSRWLERELD